MDRLIIASTVVLPAEAARSLSEGVAPHALELAAARSAKNLAVVEPDPLVLGAEVVFGQPHPDDVCAAPRLRWVHLSTAGYARYDVAAVRAALAARGAALTTSSGVYADPCAEHALAFLLSASRRLPECLENQLGPRGWPDASVRSRSALLRGRRVLLLGFGAIGRRLAELLAPFDVDLRVLRARPRGGEPFRVVVREELGDAFAWADHVVSSLPEAEGTRRLVSAALLGRMRPDAWFYNVGRGVTVDQAALLEALEARRIAGAYIDVTDPEPLPPEHPLWRAPGCTITPHTAGGRREEPMAQVEHFLANLRRFERGEPLVDRVI
ncbi:NAD(P)-dependent oxidoreductase [Sorangium atrum]|uniref:NAD(P)-dependent oxidoreductase n=1 Tax=Sorangium atrum TaxID=2995308 RepID=A0ABT5BU41_9BACT|nr:NAD(P)-dependent oxidoreductase [Sorangium aterium]MDC0677670.1 NAD(P)-dependent oxidoreductase [Sorangium aterium]